MDLFISREVVIDCPTEYLIFIRSIFVGSQEASLDYLELFNVP